MTYEEVLHIISSQAKTEIKSDREAFFSNPLKSDSTPSVHLSKKADGGAKIYAFNDNGNEAAILEALGLSMKDLYNDGITPGYTGKKDWRKKAEEYISKSRNRKLTLTDHYHYSDISTGDYCFTKLRLYKDVTDPNSKEFAYGILNRDYFTVSSSRKDAKFHLDRDNIHRAVYGDVKKIRKAIQNEDIIFICEGEKDVDTLTQYGFTAFTSGSSEDLKKYAAQCAELAKGARLIILADNDEPGMRAAAAVMEECQKTVNTVRLFIPDKKEPGADITDFFKKHNGTVNALNDMIASETDDNEEARAAAERKPQKPQAEESQEQQHEVIHVEPIKAKDLANKELPDLRCPVENMVTEGLTIIAARPKTGKSFFTLQMSLAVASGNLFLGKKTTKGNVLYFDLENGDRSMKDRILRMQADKEIPEGLSFLFREDIATANRGKRPLIHSGFEEILEDQINSDKDLSMIVIDTAVRVQPPMQKGQTQYQAEAEVYETLHDIAKKYHVAIVSIHHTRKSEDADDPLMQVSGTFGTTGSSDNIIVLTKEKRMDTAARMTAVCRDGADFERSIEFSGGVWIDRGEVSEENNESEKLIKEYEMSDIRTAIVSFTKKIKKPWKGRAGEFIQAAADFDIPVLAEAKTVGGFLYKHRPTLMKIDGVKVSGDQSGNSRVWTIFPEWQQPEGEDNDTTPFD